MEVWMKWLCIMWNYHFQKSSNISVTVRTGYFASAAPAITSTAPLNGLLGNCILMMWMQLVIRHQLIRLTNPPAGMTIDANTGLIEWTPGTAGNLDVTVVASNGVNPPATQSFTVSVTEPITLPAGVVGLLAAG